MTRDEVKALLARISICYPNWKAEDKTLTIDTWHEMLSDYKYEDMLVTLKSYIATNRSGFAPDIGQLIGHFNDLVSKVSNTYLTEMQAWALVSTALRDSTYHAKERFEALPKAVQKAVGSPDTLRAWGLDEKYNENVAQSHFVTCYRKVVEDEKMIAAMPKEVKTMIESNKHILIEDNEVKHGKETL